MEVLADAIRWIRPRSGSPKTPTYPWSPDLHDNVCCCAVAMERLGMFWGPCVCVCWCGGEGGSSVREGGQLGSLLWWRECSSWTERLKASTLQTSALGLGYRFYFGQQNWFRMSPCVISLPLASPTSIAKIFSNGFSKYSHWSNVVVSGWLINLRVIYL